MQSKCKEWEGKILETGYGYVPGGGYAHRHAYEKAKGQIPEGMLVRHKCDNRSCVNPEHLEVGTNIDNMRDMVERGRSAKGSRHSQSKFTEQQVKEIRSLKKREGISNVAISKIYGVHRTCIDKIIRRYNWKHI